MPACDAGLWFQHRHPATTTWKRQPLKCCNALSQEHDRLKTLNKKLTEFHKVLHDALGASDRASWINGQHHCLPQVSQTNPLTIHPPPVRVHLELLI